MRRDIQKNITSARFEQNSFTKHTSIDGCKNLIKNWIASCFRFLWWSERILRYLLTFVLLYCQCVWIWCARFCTTVMWTNVVVGRFITIGFRQCFAEFTYSKSACFQYLWTVQNILITSLKNCNNKCSTYRQFCGTTLFYLCALCFRSCALSDIVS